MREADDNVVGERERMGDNTRLDEVNIHGIVETAKEERMLLLHSAPLPASPPKDAPSSHTPFAPQPPTGHGTCAAHASPRQPGLQKHLPS
jgi:hypothetical protein